MTVIFGFIFRDLQAARENASDSLENHIRKSLGRTLETRELQVEHLLELTLRHTICVHGQPLRRMINGQDSPR
jgi:hypothetical protein